MTTLSDVIAKILPSLIEDAKTEAEKCRALSSDSDRPLDSSSSESTANTVDSCRWVDALD
jgi:hypothetical protein